MKIKSLVELDRRIERLRQEVEEERELLLSIKELKERQLHIRAEKLKVDRLLEECQ